MHKYKAYFSVLLLSLVLTNLALASPRNILTLDGTNALAPFAKSQRLATGESRSIEPVYLNSRISPNESVSITLDLERSYKGLEGTKIERVLLGQATYSSSHNTITAPASAVITNLGSSRRELRLLLGTNGARGLQKRHSSITLRGMLTSGSDIRVISRLGKINHSEVCATEEKSISSKNSATNHDVSIKALKQLDVLIEGDTAFHNMTGPGAITELTQVAAGADVIYRRDLGLVFNPVIDPIPATYTAGFAYDTIDSEYQLDFFPQMRAKRPIFNEDVFVVITGKTPSDSSLNNVAGIAAEIGSTCKTQSKSLTVVRRFSYSTVGGIVYTLSHEVGHLMGAEHDDQLSGNTSVGYIMNSGTGNPSQFLEQFSQYSITQIGNYFSQNGSCLANSDATPISPTPVPTAEPDPSDPVSDTQVGAYIQKVNRKDVPVFYAFQGDTPLPGYQFLVYRVVGKSYRIAARLKTRADGYVFYNKATKGKYVAVSKTDDSLSTGIVTVRR